MPPHKRGRADEASKKHREGGHKDRAKSTASGGGSSAEAEAETGPAALACFASVPRASAAFCGASTHLRSLSRGQLLLAEQAEDSYTADELAEGILDDDSFAGARALRAPMLLLSMTRLGMFAPDVSGRTAVLPLLQPRSSAQLVAACAWVHAWMMNVASSDGAAEGEPRHPSLTLHPSDASLAIR